MKVLVIGSGGREHALAWKLAQSAVVRQVFVAPGNAGTQWVGREGFAAAKNVDLHVSDLIGLRQFALDNLIDLTVIGPEVPLAEGIVDLFHAKDLPIFGPTRAAAQLEASKVFAKEFMTTFGIPTAEYADFTDVHEALAYLAALEAPHGVVVKASGLAAGKGVVVCDDIGVAQAAVRLMLEQRAFGLAGEMILIEERLAGRELSVMALCDGRTAVPLAAARDHKRVFDGGKGANTGGMGAYAPVADADDGLIREVVARVLQPAVDGMAKRGTPFIGVLYAGLMLTESGLKVLEFNCRFGDPETQVVLPLLDNELADVLMACVDGRLYAHEIKHKDQACTAVVVASEGYPNKPEVGRLIGGLAEAAAVENALVFHAGTKRQGDEVVTDGGRVLTVCGLGADVAAAAERAYAAVDKIQIEGAHYRTDIGRR